MSILTAETTLQALPAGKTILLAKINPCGSLYARKAATGAVTFSWRWTYASANDSENIGLWDPKAPVAKLDPSPAGFSVRAAARMAEDWAIEHKRHEAEGGFRGVLQRLQDAEKADLDAVKHHTLGQLMADYAALLDSRGQASGPDVRSAVRVHIELAQPELFARPAKLIGRSDVVQIVAAVNTHGYRRLSSKLRSFMQTAYATALKAEMQPDTPKHFLAYGITHNPVSDVGNPTAPKALVKPIKALNLAQMRLYWSLIKDEPGLRGAVLRLHLLTGGQRPAQLMRLQREHIEDTHIMLIDTKGRNAQPRFHVVPLTPLASQALADCHPTTPYALSVSGRTPVAKITPSNWAQDVVGDRIPGFQLKWVRSGVETLLTMWQISKETRGRLQSHGVAGVQDKHYQAFDFFEPKRDALEVLEFILTTDAKPPQSNMAELLRKQYNEAQPQRLAA